MLNLARLKAIRLHTRPLGQLVMANTMLALDYRVPKPTEIVIEGLDNLPKDRTVFLAMNHTDRYNYWPFQYAMHLRGLRYTATWVKGKYYEHPLTARFLDAMNNIPLPSRGYVLTTQFRESARRGPDQAEYRLLRDLVDKGAVPDAAQLQATTPAVRKLFDRHGHTAQAWLHWFDGHFAAMVDEVVRLNRQAVQDLNLNVLVFPQGTRSIRLSQGHTGLVQMAQHLGAPIVPVGCNGSERLYPGGSPFSKGGRIVYRIGPPLTWQQDLAPFVVPEAYQPLSNAASAKHGPLFRGATDAVMARIEALLDEPYRAAPDRESDGVKGMNRFL